MMKLTSHLSSVTMVLLSTSDAVWGLSPPMEGKMMADLYRLAPYGEKMDMRSPSMIERLEEGSNVRRFDFTYLEEPTQIEVETDQPIWPTSVSFATWVLLNREKFQGKYVLELGAGASGLPGLAAAICGAHVTLTDRDGDVRMFMPQLRKNIERNNVYAVARGLDWRDFYEPERLEYHLHEDQLHDFDHHFDIVLSCSSHFCDWDLLPSFARTVQKCLKNDKSHAFIMAPDQHWERGNAALMVPPDTPTVDDLIATMLEKENCLLNNEQAFSAFWPVTPWDQTQFLRLLDFSRAAPEK